MRQNICKLLALLMDVSILVAHEPQFLVRDLTVNLAKWMASELQGELSKICSVYLMRQENQKPHSTNMSYNSMVRTYVDLPFGLWEV